VYWAGEAEGAGVPALAGEQAASSITPQVHAARIFK
jgi:hypothetical protein